MDCANAEAATAPLQAKINAINNKQDKMGDAAALAGEKLTGLQTKADTLRVKLGDLEAAVSAAELTYSKTGKYDKTEVAAVSDALKALGSKVKALDLLKTVGDSLKDSKIYTDKLNVYTGEIKNSKNVKADVKTTPIGMGQSTYSIGYQNLPAGTSQAIGTIFTASDNNKYKITGGADRSGSIPLIPVRGSGGSVLANSPYVVGEKGPELFIPSFSGTIIPNNQFNAMYNVPNSSWGMSGSPSSGGGVYNNSYNVKIELSGTNLSADDVYNKFEQKLAMLNAKQGRNKMIGGGR